MTRIGSATIYWNDDGSLIRNVNSVTPYFDIIILIDGPF